MFSECKICEFVECVGGIFRVQNMCLFSVRGMFSEHDLECRISEFVECARDVFPSPKMCVC